ncbi:arylsulfatase A family protein [Rhizobium sp. CF122]|uniref:sulfatase-like hydrolase/transferase n=1 Tax=Rhizobium sp. CF122 TaxID=1144312 RepID=UPI0002718F0C|nr:sulfatase-like hydrolase/transferase [Rhizobium sp. CF122]EJL56383.1 arylsulfatase A family protein [Rhizobium sp. CF122]
MNSGSRKDLHDRGSKGAQVIEGASRIGQFGDSLLEGDALVGTMLDALKQLGAEEDTIVVVASDNGPDGPGASRFGADMPDMGASGLYRGAIGEVSEGAIRTAAMIRWPQRIKPRSSYAMFSIMDFFPTLAHIAGGKIPDNRPIDGVDQSKLLLGEDDNGARQHLLTFVRSELVAVRWKQFRAYFADVAPGRSGAGGAILMGGVGASAAPMNGYPGIQHRGRPATGAQYRRNVRLGFRADIEGSGGIQEDPRAVTQSTCGKHDEVLSWIGKRV